jgi:hypothetical protein
VKREGIRGRVKYGKRGRVKGGKKGKGLELGEMEG